MNKFNVGDEVVVDNKYKAEIFGIADKPDKYGEKYAVSYIGSNNSLVNVVVPEEDLKPLKAKEELEPGDKFLSKGFGYKFKVLCKAKDKRKNKIIYFSRLISDNNWNSDLIAVPENEIKEVLYND